MNRRACEGLVVKIISNRYTVEVGGESLVAYACGRLRVSGAEPYVGDRVKIIFERGSAVITDILPRKNVLIRPYVANVDVLLIVVAKEPEPDLLLVDKLILNCYKEGIKPVLCYNKSDLDLSGEAEKLFAAYGALDCIKLSAESKDGLNQLEPLCDGKLVCLAGQSAVGKTSLLNAVLDAALATDGLSKKVKRGKNTTRHIELYDVYSGKIADTCGFSMLQPIDIREDELKFYYDEFLPLQEKCRFISCAHDGEPDCAVKAAIAEGRLDKGRYERYLTIYNEIKEARRKENA